MYNPTQRKWKNNLSIDVENAIHLYSLVLIDV